MSGLLRKIGLHQNHSRKNLGSLRIKNRYRSTESSGRQKIETLAEKPNLNLKKSGQNLSINIMAQ